MNNCKDKEIRMIRISDLEIDDIESILANQLNIKNMIVLSEILSDWK